ncbi:hypothetical protein P8452_59225 [Trifolium repens]|nr:hypothetical protein P8452_59225 [Trifolium repens]
MQPSFPPYANKQITQEAIKISRAAESNSLSQSKASRPPPIAPTHMNYIIRLVLYDNGRSTEDNYDARIFCQKTTIPQKI